MSRTKKTTEPHYELLYLISNKFTEDEVKPIAEKVENIITTNGGQITYREDWGKKKLAYPVKHFVYGYYLLVEFDVEPLTLAKIERSIRMLHDVLRHQIVVRQVRTIDLKEKPKQLFVEEPKKEAATVAAPAKAGKPEVAKKEAKEEAAVEAVETKEEVVATEKKPVKAEAKAAEEKTVAEEKAPKKAAKAKDAKASLDELDAKLDKILETNDLL
jgi:small subunit ribosomal protein S6